MRVGLDTGVPVVFGVLTTENLDQALARSDPEPGGHNVGEEGAAVAVEMACPPSGLRRDGLITYPGARTRSRTFRAMQVTVLGAGRGGRRWRR